MEETLSGSLTGGYVSVGGTDRGEHVVATATSSGVLSVCVGNPGMDYSLWQQCRSKIWSSIKTMLVRVAKEATMREL